jgi:hypothetical protein
MAQPDVARRPATYADLLQVPGHLVAEILDGELHTTPRPAPRHAAAYTGLAGALHGPFDRGRGGPGGWIILCEPEIHLADDVIVPDLARSRSPISTSTSRCSGKNRPSTVRGGVQDGRLDVHLLQRDQYERATRSRLFPDLDLSWLCSLLDRPTTSQAIHALRDGLRT